MHKSTKSNKKHAKNSVTVKSTIENFPVDINNTTESLPKRLRHAIERKGERTKY